MIGDHSVTAERRALFVLHFTLSLPHREDDDIRKCMDALNDYIHPNYGSHILEQIERARHEEHIEASDEDDPFCEDPETAAQHARQFSLLKELLTATNLGTS
jgi:uncharacterized protein with ATP-grasp and redox domains